MEKKDPKQLLEIMRDGGGLEGADTLNNVQRVRDLTKGCGLTLAQAAQHAGLARSTLSKIEKCHRPMRRSRNLLLGLVFMYHGCLRQL